MSYWIDSHSHMTDDMYKEDFDKYYQNAVNNNVLISNIICLSKKDLLEAFKIKEKYPSFDISFGYFPEDAVNITQEDLDYLEEMVASGKVKAIGEIGLDYHYSKEFVDKQKELLIKQIEIANKYNVPIMIHCRDAAQDCYDILKGYAKTNVLMHCFSESLEMLKLYNKLGYYISFSGVVTFKNAQSPKINAQNVPLDHILIETDCPYLTPVPFRGKPNETSYVKYTGEYIAELLNISVEQLQNHIIENYNRFWGR